METAEQLAQTPFEIPVQPIASLQPQQLEAMQEVENAQGMSQPYMNAATGLEAAGAQPNIGQYFGAESAGVLPEMENLFGQQMAQATGNWQQQAGGVGADRIGVAQAELANQQGLSAGQTLSQIMQQSVSQAQAGAGLEQSAGTNIAGIGTAAQNAALQGATAELQSGTLAQQQSQNQQNAQYENILQQISWPFQTNQYLGSMAAGVTPAMGGTGVTSGNVKSSMMNTSGLGKGMSALGGGSAGGGSVPWLEDDGEIGGIENAEDYALGGSVDPLEIAAGRSPSLPIPMQDGGELQNFSPAAGSTIMVPFGPDLGGPQALTLNGGAGSQPAPNIHAPNITWNADPGTGSLNIRGPQGAPTFNNPFLPAGGAPIMIGGGGGNGGQSNPGGGASGDSSAGHLSSLLNSLYAERAGLMSSKPGGASGAHKRHGGPVHLDTGGEPTPIGSMIFGVTGSQTPGGGAGASVQKSTSGQEVGNLVGSNPGQNPAGGKTLIPQTTPQGRPSPQSQWLMQYRGPNPMQLGQQAAAGAGNANPFQTHPKPSDQTLNDPGQMMAAPGTGKDAGPTPPLEPASTPVAGIDFGSIFAADGGAIEPEHMDIGGDPTTMGMSSASPFTPQGEISGQVIPYNIESGIYNQPFQVAQMAGAPLDPVGAAQGQPGATPTPPPDQSQQPTPFQAPQTPTPPPNNTAPATNTGGWNPFTSPPDANDPAKRFGDWLRGTPAPSSPAATQPTQPSEPTPPLSIPPTAAEGREQQSIQALTGAAKPQPPMPQPRPPGAPGAGQPAQPGAPPVSPGVQKAQQILNSPVGNMINQFPALKPYSNMIPDQNMPVRQWMDAHPDMARQMMPYLSQAGITQQDMQTAMQAKPAAAPGVPQYPGLANSVAAQWRQAGASENAIKGVLYNINAESSFHPGLRHPDQPRFTGEAHFAHGLYQHGGNQWNGLERYAQQQGADWRDPRVQTAYEIENLRRTNPGVWAQMNNAGSWQDAAKIYARWLAPKQEFLNQRIADIGRAAEPLAGYVPSGGGSRPNENAEQPPSAAQPTTTGSANLDQRGPFREGETGPLRPVSKMGQFLTTLGTGDPTAYFRTRMAELGLYKEAAAWDAARNVQYASLAPPQAGAALANEAGATLKAVGAVSGAEEQTGAPGTVTHAAATGNTTAHPGANVQPVGGAGAPPSGPGAGAPPTGALPQTGARPIDRMTDEAIQRGMMAISSGNPQAIATGNSILNGLIQRGAVDAETLQKRINAAKSSFGFIPGMGPVQYTPDGGIRPLLPGSTATPNISGALPPPSPGSMPTTQTPPPVLGGNQPSFAPASVIPPPAPAGGAPQPLPTGAEPRPPSTGPSGGPAARDFSTDPAFQPRAQVPRTSAEMMRDPVASSMAYDERAWTPEGQKMIAEEAGQAQKDAVGRIQADRQADLMLSELEESLSRLPKSGILAPGPTMQARNHIVGLYNDIARITAPALGNDALPQVDPGAIGSVEQINKLSNTLAFALARTLGSREAVQIVQQARNSVPSADVSPRGARTILEGLRAGISMDFDYYSGLQNWSSSNLLYSNSIKGFDQWFAQTHPRDMYTMRANALSARDPHDTPITPQALEALRAHPDRAAAFDNQYGVPGLGAYYLRQHGVQ